MTLTRLLLALLLSACAAPAEYTIHVVPHSHIDVEWYWTYEQTRHLATRILGQAIATMKRDPRYCFTQDQMLALQPFWEQLDAADREYVRRAVQAGRFEIAGGSYVQPENAEPDFESLSRQFLLAKPWMESTFGARITTCWNLDVFGQTVQMPQLARRSGAGLRAVRIHHVERYL